MNNYKTTEFKNTPTMRQAFKQNLPMIVISTFLATVMMVALVRSIH